jgi:creatinine amidohydrolase
MKPTDVFAPATLHLESLTWPEVEEALARGWTRIVIPVGAVEQHGHHLPLSVDTLRGGETGRRVAVTMGNCLVAPTIPVGCSEHHMGFPGTLTLRRETLQGVVKDYVESLLRHGFDAIYVLPTHGGNFLPLRDLLPELQDGLPAGTSVLGYTDLEGFLEIWRSAIEEAGGDPSGVGGHAGLAESSEILVIRPDLVRRESAKPGVPGPPSPEILQRVFAEGFHAVTQVGVLGDPRTMSRKLGEACLAQVAQVVTADWKRQLGETG